MLVAEVPGLLKKTRVTYFTRFTRGASTAISSLLSSSSLDDSGVLPGGCEMLPEGPPNSDIVAQGSDYLARGLWRGVKLLVEEVASRVVVVALGRQRPDCNGRSNLFGRQK